RGARDLRPRPRDARWADHRRDAGSRIRQGPTHRTVLRHHRIGGSMTTLVENESTTGAPRSNSHYFEWFGRYGALLVLAALIIVTSILAPNTFPTVDNAINILNQSALSAIIAMGLTFVLVTGEFDLNIG